MAYPTAINYVGIINHQLDDVLQSALRFRFYNGNLPKEDMRHSRIDKITNSSEHLRITDGDKQYKVKYTTMGRTAMYSPEELGDYTGDTKPIARPLIKLSATLQQYTKTWGGIDLILVEWELPDVNKSVLYWLDAKQLLALIAHFQLPQEVELPGSNVAGGLPHTVIYSRETLSTGLDIERDLNDIFGIVRQIDVVDFDKKIIYPTKKYFHKTNMGSDGLDFSPDMFDFFHSDWKTFPLRGLGKADKAVIVTVIETGKEQRFTSGVMAAQRLSEGFGIKISPAQISQVLRGKAKTIKTPKGRITVRQASV